MKFFSLVFGGALVLGFCALDASWSEEAFRSCLEQRTADTCHHALYR